MSLMRRERRALPSRKRLGGIGVTDLVTVFESSDIALFAMAKATLDEAGIRYVAQGEAIQDLYGVGRLGLGYSLVTGPPRIRVVADDAARARDLLVDLNG